MITFCPLVCAVECVHTGDPFNRTFTLETVLDVCFKRTVSEYFSCILMVGNNDIVLLLNILKRIIFQQSSFGLLLNVTSVIFFYCFSINEGKSSWVFKKDVVVLSTWLLRNIFALHCSFLSPVYIQVVFLQWAVVILLVLAKNSLVLFFGCFIILTNYLLIGCTFLS